MNCTNCKHGRNSQSPVTPFVQGSNILNITNQVPEECRKIMPQQSSSTLFPIHNLLSSVHSATSLQAGRSPIRFPMLLLEFFIDLILPATQWPWGQLSL